MQGFGVESSRVNSLLPDLSVYLSVCLHSELTAYTTAAKFIPFRSFLATDDGHTLPRFRYNMHETSKLGCPVSTLISNSKTKKQPMDTYPIASSWDS